MSSCENLIDLLYSISDRELLEDFILGVTTENERQELSKRIEIIKRLITGEAQQNIARELGVGIATVTRGSKELAQGRFKVLK